MKERRGENNELHSNSHVILKLLVQPQYLALHKQDGALVAILGLNQNSFS